MIPEDRMGRDIQRDEAWFRDRCVDRGGPNVDDIKARVRVAAHEEWLARTIRDEVPAALADRSKASVREAMSLDRHPAGRSPQPLVPRGPRPHRRLFGWIGGLTAAAAACIALVIGLPHRASATEDISYVEAFAGFQDDDLTASLARLGDEFRALEVVTNDSGLGESDGFELDESSIDEAQPQGDRKADDGSSHRG